MALSEKLPHLFTGQCHCGAIAVRLAYSSPAAEIQVRSCQCGFCLRQGAITVSDPRGRATLEIDAAHLTRYQFATATATSLICARCGIYAGAMLRDGDAIWSIANARGLGISPFAGRIGEPMVYEHETPEARIARRKQRWTPTEIHFKT